MNCEVFCRMAIFQIISETICVLLFLSKTQAEKNEQKDFFLNFHQHDYQMKVERIEIVRYNKQYTDATVKTFKYNRTCTAFNATANVKVDMGYSPEVVIQAYRFASNEYRLFPMRFQLNACEALSKNVFGSTRLTNCGNAIGCPLKKGKYEVCNFTPDPSMFPPLIPSGRYMWEMQGLYLSQEIAVARAYMEVFRPIAYVK